MIAVAYSSVQSASRPLAGTNCPSHIVEGSLPSNY